MIKWKNGDCILWEQVERARVREHLQVISFIELFKIYSANVAEEYQSDSRSSNLLTIEGNPGRFLLLSFPINCFWIQIVDILRKLKRKFVASTTRILLARNVANAVLFCEGNNLNIKYNYSIYSKWGPSLCATYKKRRYFRRFRIAVYIHESWHARFTCRKISI